MFECDFPECGKAYPKLWRLKEHQCSAHTGEVRGWLARLVRGII